jgi:hypothetical protein
MWRITELLSNPVVLGWEIIWVGKWVGGIKGGAKNYRNLGGKIMVFEFGLGITWVILAV